MKKLLTLTISFAFALPFVASAASFVVTPSSGSYIKGDTITLNINVSPSSSTVYTAMLDARFSPEVFEVVSFSFNDSMLPLKQSGYDALNNTTGVLTKTGGYTGGASSVTSFGTLVLRAKESGTGTFTIADSSKLLDSNNTDQQRGTQTASFVVTAKPVAVVKPATAPSVVAQKKTEQPKTKEIVAPKVQVETKQIAEVSENKESATSTQLAAVSGAGTASSLAYWMLGIIAMLGIFGLGYFTGTRRSYSFVSK